MDAAVEKLHEASEELRRALVGLDGRAQLQLLNGSTAAVARLRVEVDSMRADALELLVTDLQDDHHDGATPGNSEHVEAELDTAG